MIYLTAFVHFWLVSTLHSTCFTPEVKQSFVPRLINFLNPFTRQQQCFAGFGCVAGFEKSDEFGRYLGLLLEYADPPEDIDVTFHVFGCRHHRYHPVIVPYNDELAPSELPFDRNKTTVMIIHGFIDYYSEMAWNGYLKDFIFDQHCHKFNVIAVDWRKASGTCNYFNAIANTQVVALVVTKFVRRLMDTYNLDAGNFVLVGHSLGSHIAGFVGANFSNPQINMILGLDPAGPGFNDVANRYRLDPSDARLVVAIHTNKGREKKALSGLGTRFASGHYNFYPNGGNLQPGCPVQAKEEGTFSFSSQNPFRFLETCSHNRATWLVQIKPSQDCQSIAYRCSSWRDYELGQCGQCRPNTDDCRPLFGFFDLWLKTRLPAGRNKSVSYFVATSGESDYCVHQYQLVIKTGRVTSPFRGNIKVELRGKQYAETFNLRSNPFQIKANQEITSLVKLPKAIGKLASVSLELVPDSSISPRSILEIEIKSIQFNFMSSEGLRRRKALSVSREFSGQVLGIGKKLKLAMIG